MYYNEFEKTRRMGRILERLAYYSVGLDFFVAIATLLVMRGAAGSSFMLLVAGYLMFAEVVIATILFTLLIAVRHYRRVIEAFMLNTFINKYHTESVAWKVVSILKRIVTLDI
jgi:hypothetical protein